MNGGTKKRIAGCICLLGAFIMLFCISRMIPYGLAGNAHEVKVWFTLAAIAFIVSLPFGVAYYFFKAAQKSSDGLNVEVQTLATYAKQHKEAQSTEHSAGVSPKK